MFKLISREKIFVSILVLLILLSVATLLFLPKNKIQDNSNAKQALVDYDAFYNLTKEVREHREKRVVSLDEFVKMSKEENTIILDTRSNRMYAGRHIKGAKHLDFTEFTQDSLARVIPSMDTRILIYCNNNIEDDPVNFASKVSFQTFTNDNKPVTLALNIPTYINLYGYGYKNVYELKEMISVNDKRVEFESRVTN